MKYIPSSVFSGAEGMIQSFERQNGRSVDNN